MVAVRVIVLMQMFFICVAFAGTVKRPENNLFLEGQSCITPNVVGGKCMKQSSCDPAFIHSFPYRDHTFVCRQDAFVPTICCQPFLDFCKNFNNFQIYHGKEAEKRMFPHIARLGRHDGYGDFIWECSANIISTRFLLSAAHCKPTAEKAGMDCNANATCEQTILVQKFIQHPDYNKAFRYHDIALVELQADIPFNKRVLPICPYHGREDFPVLENLTIAGWGRKENYMTSNRLMYATVKTVPLEECKTHYENQMLARLNRGIVAEQYCAQGALVEHVYEHVDACQGDSGGPLLVQQANNVILIGVISVGIGCGSKLPGLYTRVGSYFEWINNTITESQSKQTS